MKRLPLSFFITFLAFSLVILAFLWWNNYPSLLSQSNPPIYKLHSNKTPSNPKQLKIISYNIHFGVGLNIKTKDTDQQSYINRLDDIAEIFNEIDADVILLQEVDFNSKRSQYIDQAKYLASKSNYQYVAIAPHFRKKFLPGFNGMHGKVDHGLAILSRYPIEYNEAMIFDYPEEIPFYLRWVFSPHGAQKCNININNTILSIINVHLEPWAQYSREEQIGLVKDQWLKATEYPIILGGDFNAIPPEIRKNIGFHLLDAPWFINRKRWDIKNEKTIRTVRKLGFSEAVPIKIYFSNKNAAYTFPADDPKEKIDYIFAGNKARIIFGYIFHDAKTQSDHLPIVAYIKYKN